MELPQFTYARPPDLSGIDNALAGRRADEAARQEAAVNQLKLQAWQEDRAYLLKQREAAAAKAASERTKTTELRNIYGNYGVTPAVTGARGMSYSGTDVANNPDETLFNNLVRGGFVPQAEAMSKARGEFSKTEADKIKLDAIKYDDALARTTPLLAMVQNADDVARYVRLKYQDPVLGPIAAKMRPVEDAVRVSVDQFTKDPQGTLSALAGLTGAAIAKQKFEIDKQDAELAKLKAETAKFAAEAKGKGALSAFGDTNEGRQLEIIKEVAQGTRSPNDPEYAIAYHAQYGSQNVAAYNPDTNQMELVRGPATPPPNLPPPTYGAAAPAAVPTNALPAVNGVRPAGVPTNALAAPAPAPTLIGAVRPVAPVVTKPSVGKLTEAQKFRVKSDTSKDYAFATETLRNVQDVVRTADELKKANLIGVTGYMSKVPSFSDKSTIAETNIAALKGKMTAVAKTLSAATGKLGNLAVQEYQMLQDQIANFDPYKGEAATRKQLDDITSAMKRIENSVRDAYSREYGGEDNPFEQFRELPADVGAHPSHIQDILSKYK